MLSNHDKLPLHRCCSYPSLPTMDMALTRGIGSPAPHSNPLHAATLSTAEARRELMIRTLLISLRARSLHATRSPPAGGRRRLTGDNGGGKKQARGFTGSGVLP